MKKVCKGILAQDIGIKQVQIVNRLFLVNCMETYRLKQKQIETEVFTIYVGGLVIH